MFSNFFSSNDDLNNVANGGRRILSPETSDSVGLIQQGLLTVGETLPDAGVDSNFGTETGNVVSAFKANRFLSPADPVVGPGTLKRLDLEIAFLEGNAPDPASLDSRTLVIDPFLAGVYENQLGNPSIGQSVIDSFELGDRLCWRMSFELGTEIAKLVGKFVEPFVFDDFKMVMQPSGPEDFFDRDISPTPYVNFLLGQHPNLDPVAIRALGVQKRPDILRNRPAFEWYELKPRSLSGVREAVEKSIVIPFSYATAGLPYKRGRVYRPSPEIRIWEGFTDGGEHLIVYLEVVRAAPGILFYTFCVKGDYVRYFNRVRLAAGILAILVEIGAVLLPAAEGAGLAEAIMALAAELGIGTMPAFVR